MRGKIPAVYNGGGTAIPVVVFAFVPGTARGVARLRQAIPDRRQPASRRDPGQGSSLIRTSSRTMTAILGISAFYHDSAAALVVDGDIIAAAQEERFTRKKHDAAFPANAVAYCLREGGITSEELDLVGFYEKPLVKFSRLIET